MTTSPLAAAPAPLSIVIAPPFVVRLAFAEETKPPSPSPSMSTLKSSVSRPDVDVMLALRSILPSAFRVRVASPPAFFRMSAPPCSVMLPCCPPATTLAVSIWTLVPAFNDALIVSEPIVAVAAAPVKTSVAGGPPP